MPIVTMSLGEALEKGYEIVGAQQPYREEATAWETANIIGREVIPAIGGAMLGSIGGPWGAAGGGAAGSSWGNYLSQQYRVDRGLQSGINPGEMVAATVAGAIPFGALPGKGALARTAIRGAQGATVAAAETTGRTLIDEGRAPTQDELLTSVLFGGTIGGVMGAGEAAFAKWKSGAPFEGGENQSGALALIEKEFTEATPFTPPGLARGERWTWTPQERLDDKPIVNSLALETAGDGNILVLEDKIILPPVRGSGGEVISLDDAPDWVNIGGKQTRDISALQKKLDALVDEGKMTKKERAKLIRNARKREFGTDRVFTSVPEGEQAFDPRFYDLINGEYVQKAIRQTTAIQLAQDVLDVTQADLANDVSGYVKRIAQAQAGSLSEQDEGLRNLLESGLTQPDLTRTLNASTQDPVTGKLQKLENETRPGSVVGEEERLARVAAGEQQPSAAAGLTGMLDTRQAASEIPGHFSIVDPTGPTTRKNQTLRARLAQNGTEVSQPLEIGHTELLASPAPRRERLTEFRKIVDDSSGLDIDADKMLKRLNDEIEVTEGSSAVGDFAFGSHFRNTQHKNTKLENLERQKARLMSPAVVLTEANRTLWNDLVRGNEKVQRNAFLTTTARLLNADTQLTLEAIKAADNATIIGNGRNRRIQITRNGKTELLPTFRPASGGGMQPLADLIAPRGQIQTKTLVDWLRTKWVNENRAIQAMGELVQSPGRNGVIIKPLTPRTALKVGKEISPDLNRLVAKQKSIVRTVKDGRELLANELTLGANRALVTARNINSESVPATLISDMHLDALRKRVASIKELNLPDELELALIAGESETATAILNAWEKSLLGHLIKVGLNSGEALHGVGRLSPTGLFPKGYIDPATNKRITQGALVKITERKLGNDELKHLLPGLGAKNKIARSWLKVGQSNKGDAGTVAVNESGLPDPIDLSSDSTASPKFANMALKVGEANALLNALKSPGLSPGNLTASAAIAGAGISQMSADERDELLGKVSRGDISIFLALGGLLLLGTAGRQGIRTAFRRSDVYKAATNPKTQARMVEQQPNSPNSPNTGYESTINATLNPNSVVANMQRMVAAATRQVADLAEPLSRTLKSVGRKWDEKSGTLKINKYFAAMMRAVEQDASTTKVRFREKLIPIVSQMYTKTGKVHHEAITDALLHTTQDTYATVLRILEGANENVEWNVVVTKLREGLAEVRAFGREQGGLDIGELKDFFPRQVLNRLTRNPKELRRELRDAVDDEGVPLLNDDSDLTRALNAEAKMQDRTGWEKLSNEDIAAVTQKYLQENLHRRAGGLPGGAKERRVGRIHKIVSKYYADPIDGLEAYIDGIVEKSVWNRFRNENPKVDLERDKLDNIRFTEERKTTLLQQMDTGEASIKKVGGGKFRVSYVDSAGQQRTANLNTKVPVTDGIAKVTAVNKIADLDLDIIKNARKKQRQDLGSKRDERKFQKNQEVEFMRKHGALSAEDRDIVDKVFESRMESNSGMNPVLKEIKDLGYLMVLSNLGSVMTQFADVAFSLHRNGLNATMQAAVRREYDLAKKLGISTYELNNMSSSGGGVAKVLNWTFDKIKFSQVDKFGANTFLNARYIKMKNQARAGGAAEAKLRSELDEYGGFLDTNQVIYDLKTNKLTDSVEAVLYNEILDVRPANLSEMSGAYVRNPNGRIFYMLKSYQLKQIDYFREHSENQILEGKLMMQQGNTGGAKRMAEGIMQLAGLGAIFVGVSGSMDVAKDVVYGRPIDMDDKMSDAGWRLFGLSRYFPYQVRREGPISAAADWALPPLSAYSRPFKDIIAIEDGFAGETTRGLPGGDFYYWYFGGGRDKIKRDLERKSD
jgi:hypothetical protein